MPDIDISSRIASSATLALKSGEWFFLFVILDHHFLHAIHLNDWPKFPRPPLQTHTELAAKAIADAEYRLVQKDKNSYLVLIEGLAHLAAITRSTDLAAETLVLLKRTLNLGFEKIEAFQVV